MEETAHIIKVETSRQGNRSGKGSRFIRGNRFRDNRAGSKHDKIIEIGAV